MFLVFEEKPPKQILTSCFGSDSALKTTDAQMLFWSVFLKMHFKKVIKGTVQQDFDPQFFHPSNLPGPLTFEVQEEGHISLAS